MKTLIIFIITSFISLVTYSQSISTKKNTQTVSKIDNSIVVKQKTIGVVFNPIKNQQTIINKSDIKQEDNIIISNITTNKNEKPK